MNMYGVGSQGERREQGGGVRSALGFLALGLRVGALALALALACKERVE